MAAGMGTDELMASMAPQAAMTPSERIPQSGFHPCLSLRWQLTQNTQTSLLPFRRTIMEVLLYLLFPTWTVPRLRQWYHQNPQEDIHSNHPFKILSGSQKWWAMMVTARTTTHSLVRPCLTCSRPRPLASLASHSETSLFGDGANGDSVLLDLWSIYRHRAIFMTKNLFLLPLMWAGSLEPGSWGRGLLQLVYF